MTTVAKPCHAPPATISVVAEAFEGGRRIPGDARLQFSFSQGPSVPRAVSNDLWWGGPSENGWGFSTLTRFGPKLFNVLFVYDQAGAPTWFVQPQGSYLDGGPGLRYSAPIYSPRSAPWYAYSTASFVPGSPVWSCHCERRQFVARTTIRFAPIPCF